MSGEMCVTSTVKNRIHCQTHGNAATDSITQGTIDRAVLEFVKRPNACVVPKGGHFYY